MQMGVQVAGYASSAARVGGYSKLTKPMPGKRVRPGRRRVIPNAVFIHRLGWGLGLLSGFVAEVPRVEYMFDGSLPEIGDLTGVADAALVDAARGWAQAENAACARKQAVMAELFVRRTALPADERELWWIDPEAAVVAELAAAQHISRGLAQHQTHRGVALRDRLPKIAALFAAGLISDLLVRAIVWRTYLIADPDAMAAVDAELAEQVTAWAALSAKKIEQAIDALVEAHDPGALRRARDSARTRDVQFGSPTDEAGFTTLWARLYSGDAAVLQDRVSEIAHSVCEADPRTTGERRADAVIALSAGQQQLTCGCADPDCAAAQHDQKPPVSTVIHVVTDAATVAAATTPAAEPGPDPTPTTPPRVRGADHRVQCAAGIRHRWRHPARAAACRDAGAGHRPRDPPPRRRAARTATPAVAAACGVCAVS